VFLDIHRCNRTFIDNVIYFEIGGVEDRNEDKPGNKIYL
jgi:hypothetical protein